jgi:hypothetical protein
MSRLYPISPGRRNAVRERDRSPLSFAKLRSERTRVSCSPDRNAPTLLNTILFTQRKSRQNGDIARFWCITVRGVSSARGRSIAPCPAADHQSNEVCAGASGVYRPRSPISFEYSVMGIIAIPGMMTGAILGGADVRQAARLQMIIMFMITASSTLSCIAGTLFTLYECIDSEHRIRSDRIFARPHVLRRVSGDAVQAVVDSVRRLWSLSVKQIIREGDLVNGDEVGVNGRHGRGIYSPSERSPLLP